MTKLACLFVASLVTMAACDRAREPWPGSGGFTWGSGGALGSGGEVGSGGSWGTGGRGGSGGRWGSGGAVGSGGWWGSGGAVGSGGWWGSGGKLGSGGNGGSGGLLGSGGGSCVAGNTPVTGVSAVTGCPGVFEQGSFGGYFYTFSDAADGGTSSICPDCTELGCSPVSASAMCAAGRAGKVIGSYYSIFWGAGVAWNIADPVVPPDCSGGSAATASLAGRTINAAFDFPPAAFRMILELVGDPATPCVDISGKAAVSVSAESFVNECWVGGSKTPVTAAQLSSVRAIRFLIPTNTSADVPFSFCITELSIL